MFFIAPIDGVSFEGSDANSLRIDRVTFIDRKAFLSDPAAFGIKTPFFESLKKDEVYSKVFVNVPSIALLRQEGDHKTIETDCFRRIRDEIAMLSMSRLGVGARRYSCYVGVSGEHATSQIQHFHIGKNGTLSFSGQINRLPFPLALDKHWYQTAKDWYFMSFLDLLQGKIATSSSWKEDLRRAAILLGKSANTNDLALAFLWNMIAFELLLTQQGDSYSKVLPKRAKAFLGWLDQWNAEDFPGKIEQLYDLRCRFVHDGNTKNITIPDLLFTDTLVVNIFADICRSLALFPTKSAVIDFAEMVAAQELLGLKDTSFQFMQHVYNEEDYRTI